jgi:hypothetical protein
MSNDDLGYPDGIYQYIFKMCFLHPINICAGFYYGNPIGGAMGLALFGTSLNYWRYPVVKSYRRIMDMAVAFIAVPYHIYLSTKTTNKLLCMGPLVFGSAMYPVSLGFNWYKYFGTEAFCHCLLHLSVIAGATFTYRDLH